MLFSIKCGNVPGVSPDQRQLAYLVSSTEAAYDAGLACVFTDGNAATAFTDFFDDPTDLATVVDWPVMRLGYWANTADDPDRRRRRMAEFLVHEAAPLALITEIGVYDAEVATVVADLATAEGRNVTVPIRRSWYF
jgi:ssDNA thymidine ADP-ribosyltransferase DarT-like protein